MCTAVHFCNFCPFTSKKSGLRFVDWLSKMLYAGLSTPDSDCRLLTHDCLHLPDFLQKYHFIQLSLGKAGHKRMLQDNWIKRRTVNVSLQVSWWQCIENTSWNGWKSFKFAQSPSCCSSLSVNPWIKLSSVANLRKNHFCKKNHFWHFHTFATTTKDYGYRWPMGRRLEYGFRPLVGIRNVIPRGFLSWLGATRDDIPDPHSWSKPIPWAFGPGVTYISAI